MRDDERVTGWALAARDGDDRAVEQFVRATQLDVRRYVTHLSGEAQAADDLVQDTYVRALRSLPRFEGRSSARTWLLTIARRVVADRIRTHAVRPRLSATEDWQSAAERVQPRGVPGFEEGIALAELLASLTAQRREAFVLTQLLGLPYAAAAGVMGCPVGTVRSRVARARETLIALLAEAEAEMGEEPESGAVAESRVDEAEQRQPRVGVVSAHGVPYRRPVPGPVPVPGPGDRRPRRLATALA
ncbi:RNA polymerase subunit sigma [Streptomyces sp. NRRL F-4489]|uniref:sigma-70 family RNA polymerase sigma factor n=1 Tax=Streptomyces sp. NRRL F-4489 TaxID=1609095 RepID=UPI0007475D05|nr:sigma-70 family RNA polymerase sigma factor [Streptomyces sp. NRRL F-4489]KUL33616.1 RNA polymerase subunit sigma [Streptomyces sp. NRRL F-4489]